MRLSAVVLPDLDPPARFVDTVREVEAAGLRTAWTYDHLSWRDLREGPWHAAVPLLAAAAAATTRVRLGTLVANPNVRHPVPFAKEVMTLDALCAGRLDLGVGAGGLGADATVLGEPPWSARERADRFAEWVALLDRLLREPATTWRGEHYAAVDARQLPGCVQRPRVPLTVAAAGPRAMNVVARHGDAWVTYGPVHRPGETEGTDQDWYAAVAAQARALDAALADQGRAPDSVRRLVQVGLDVRWPVEGPGAYEEFLGRVAALGADEVVVHWPRPHDGRGLAAAELRTVLAAHGLL